MSTTPDCRCGHPSRYHEPLKGQRPFRCGKCVCQDWVPTIGDIATRLAEHIRKQAKLCEENPEEVGRLALGMVINGE